MSGKNFRDRIRRPTSINTNAENQTNAKNVSTPQTNTSTPSPQLTPAGVRGKTDIRSPGVEKSPKNVEDHFPDDEDNDSYPIPDFMTQTDKYGRASTPRTADAIATAHADTNLDKSMEEEPYDNILDSLRMMCCCFLPEEPNVVKNPTDETLNSKNTAPQSTTREAENEKTTIKLLPQLHPKDHGKKCLVLDLDETLVHSSFRAVTGADFVIPVQIEDVVHFVYVAKRPGVDQFLLEMAKHYEIVIYTASLNKYADPLLDLLDIHGVIRTRLFRESCVYYEGNYVKDLSLLDRDLSQSIIIDNSPSSYIFHPENAIDCSSFIDDPKDRELDQIGKFLAGVRDVNDVRDVCSYWKKWPSIPAITGVRYEDEERVLK
eukprot:CAMPEP_0197840912 /NCGR_PEP_ID=MMETSP1437-20131217/45878_1 /TAXON_ID=49252 ORGANISM="Eucampia antarctica, Strain CCMP1452" /NCGR_SAMPLE_ID=MMETSP1437 /ASSEMBLY_ACC=CAM_ASM_001096 /LENGTH=374 /DNA_ID=CAMNT_0043450591 /DNA_START=403 /DNA_END=1527 /DNA_ORIENTATION=+